MQPHNLIKQEKYTTFKFQDYEKSESGKAS